MARFPHNEIEAYQPLVLVVDDEDLTRLFARQTLEAAGFRVEEATDGEAGLAAIKRLAPDLVMLMS